MRVWGVGFGVYSVGCRLVMQAINVVFLGKCHNHARPPSKLDPLPLTLPPPSRLHRWLLLQGYLAHKKPPSRRTQQ